MALNYKTIQPLLITQKNSISKWVGYIGLGVGVLILMLSMQMFINIQKLLKENNPRKAGYDFISISKSITNENMGSDNTFSDSDIIQLESQPGIDAVSPLIANQFRVRMSAGNVIPFSTDLFLESLDNDFIDTVPSSFTWQPGQRTVPIIFSSDFLEMYNVFAPAQGLPQLSPKSISSVNVILECSGPGGIQNFTGNIVALSDRINSVLVPKSFMEWSNTKIGYASKVQPSRVFIKTKDANSPRLLTYLDKENYHINKDKTKFGRVKSILQNIVSALAVFGILVIGLALMLFSFYLQLMIARSKDNLVLLLTLGYSPRWLGKSVVKTWLPVYISVVAVALIITWVMHFFFIHLAVISSAELPWSLHWSVFLMAAFLLLLTLYLNSSLVKRELNKIM